MNTHSIELDGYYARSRGSSTIYLGTAGSHGNEQLQVTQGKGWEGLTVQVVFHPSKVAVLLPVDGLLDVPWEATAQPLTMMQGRIVFQGFDHDRLVNSTDLAYTVASHSPVLGRDEEPYTPGIVEGVLNQMAADKDAILQAAQQTGQAKEAAAASAAEAAGSAAKAQQSAGAANTSAGQAAASASQAAGSAAAAGETLTQVQTAGQEAQQKVKDAETEALDKIAAAAPALPAVSTDAAWQSVTVKPDGTGYNLAALAPIEATIRPTVTGNPAVCENSAAWGLQGLKIYGKSVQNGTPSPDNPIDIVSAGASGSITLSITDGADQGQSLTVSTPSGLLGIPVESGGNYTDSTGQQWVCDVVDLQSDEKTQNLAIIQITSDYQIDLQPGQNRFVIGVGDSYNIGNERSPVLGNVASTQSPISGSQNNQIFQYNNQVYWYGIEKFYSVDTFKQWLNSNDFYILLQLAEPVISALSPEEIAAYRALTTYPGTTVVSTSEPVAGLEVQYLADGTKKVQSMESRLAALEAAQTGI